MKITISFVNGQVEQITNVAFFFREGDYWRFEQDRENGVVYTYLLINSIKFFTVEE